MPEGSEQRFKRRGVIAMVLPAIVIAFLFMMAFLFPNSLSPSSDTSGETTAVLNMPANMHPGSMLLAKRFPIEREKGGESKQISGLGHVVVREEVTLSLKAEDGPPAPRSEVVVPAKPKAKSKVGAEIRDVEKRFESSLGQSVVATSRENGLRSLEDYVSPRRSLTSGKWGFHRDKSLDERCDEWVDDRLIHHWNSGKRAVCSPTAPRTVPLVPGRSRAEYPEELRKRIEADGSGVVTFPRVVEWRLPHYAHNPQVREHHDVVLVGGAWGHPEKLYCNEEKPHFHHEDGRYGRDWLVWSGSVSNNQERDAMTRSNPVTDVFYDRVLIRVVRFDWGNPYEGFHSLFNVYIIMRQFKLNPRDVQFVLFEGGGKSEKDDSIWRALSGNNHPPLYGAMGSGPASVRILAKHVLDAPSGGSSLISTAVGPIRGRGDDHHCKSSILRDTVNFIRAAFDVPPPPTYMLKNAPSEPPSPIKIIVSSRRDFANQNGDVVNVARKLAREEEFVAKLKRLLGEGHEVELVDFAALTPKECIAKTSASHVVIGVHGAGLMWAAYLPRHGLLVELFGGNRPSTQRHYHNIASLADIHYASHDLTGSDVLHWSEETVRGVGENIKNARAVTRKEPGV